MSIKVIIGIQARSGSKRLPGKSLRVIEDKTMVELVHSAAKRAAGYINRTKTTPKIICNVVLLIPTDDPIKEHFPNDLVVEGSEDDVLSRYELAFKQFKPDYLVRITGDCPLIIPTIISKHVFCTISSKKDYLSNSFDELRTYVDGFDCEVISAKLFEWVLENAKNPADREHVTTLIKREPPNWAEFGVVMNHIDLSNIKLSVDTIEEFYEVEKMFTSLSKKFNKAKALGYDVFRF